MARKLYSIPGQCCLYWTWQTGVMLCYSRHPVPEDRRHVMLRYVRFIIRRTTRSHNVRRDSQHNTSSWSSVTDGSPPPHCLSYSHGRRSSVNFRGAQNSCPKKYVLKLAKCPNFTWFLPEKLSEYPNFMIFARIIYKIPEFYMIFARKMPEFYKIIARKIFFPEF